jgi:DNA-binding transcriptional ArsR family regulator
LTGDQPVTHSQGVTDVFRAIADPVRRTLLDRLFRQNGLTLSDLCDGLGMTRFGVMKHLRVLEAAGLITTRKVGRSRRHYLDPVPIRLIHHQWLGKYTSTP